MTTLYKPTPITSVEQADALPDGAIVIGVETGERYMRLSDEWIGISEMGPRLAIDLDMGDSVQALVPVEAEEERQAIAECEIGAPGSERITHQRRLVTPWEEA